MKELPSQGKGIGPPPPIRYVEEASKEVEEEGGGGGRPWWRGPCLSPGLLSMVCKSRLCTLYSSEGEVRLVSGLLLYFFSRAVVVVA